jgi:hypothetical protein
MKQQDLATIAGAVVVSAIVSIFLAKFAFSFSTSSQTEQVDVVPPISASFSAPSSQYFNSSSIDPTQLIRIGDNATQTPFSTSNQ